MGYNNFTFLLDEIKEAARENRLLSVEIEPTLACNYHCPYCYAANNDIPENELSYEELCDVISQAHEMGAGKVVILGGEPLLYDRLYDLIDYINSFDMTSELFSNGALLTPEVAGKLFEKKVNLVLKLNSFKAEVQARLTGEKNALDSARTAIENARNAGYPAENARLAVSTIISNANIDEMEELWRYARDNGITPYFEAITPQGKASENDWLHPDSAALQKVFERLSEVDREYGHDWVPRPPLVGDRCMRHLYSCLVTSSGKVFPCVGIDEPVGDIRETPLYNIIHDSEIIQDLRSYADKIKEPCASCEIHSECFGCRGAAYQLTGDWLAADPMCWKHQEKRDCIDFLPVDAEKFIPHKPPVRMVGTLDKIGEQYAEATVNVAQDVPYVDESGKVLDSAFIEMIAQSLAVDDGFGRNGACEGMIIGVNNFNVHGFARAGDCLKIRIFKDVKFGNWGIVHGQVYKSGELIAEAEVKVWKE